MEKEKVSLCSLQICTQVIDANILRYSIPWDFLQQY